MSSAPPSPPHSTTLTAHPSASSTPHIDTSAAADHGPAANAHGSAIQVRQGRYSYTVAAGDTPSGIAARFGLCLGDLFAANTGLQGDEADMQIGQVITIRRVPSDNDASANCMMWPSS